MSNKTQADFFQKELTRAHSAIANVCKLDKNAKSSYDKYINETLNEEVNLIKGLDLHIFGHVEGLVHLIEELDQKIELLEKEVEVYKKIVNKLFKDN